MLFNITFSLTSNDSLYNGKRKIEALNKEDAIKKLKGLYPPYVDLDNFKVTKLG